MTTSDYINRAFRTQPGRKYYNHMAKHSPGEWHRHWLLTSGQYIKTSNPDMRKGYGWKTVGEDGPELLNFRPGGVMHDRELDRRRLVDFPHWAVNDCESWAL